MTEKPRPSFICPHLAAIPGDYHIWFTGYGMDCDWVCSACAKEYPNRPAEMIEVTDELFERFRNDFSHDGICGRPEFRQRESSLRFVEEDFAWSSLGNERWIDIQPNPMAEGEWFVLLDSGNFALANPRKGEFQIRYRLDALGFSIDDETGLCLSPRADFGAVYQASDRHAFVFDLATGKGTAQIDRGDYRPENSCFPIAFFVSGDRTLLVAATDWNRLDIIDPATGWVLTKRGPTSYKKGEVRPPHYLDYFHAQLSVSPDHHWIVDNGWFWHPWGIVQSWNLRDWLQKNVWESEDGPSLRALAGRSYWDGPLCWIGDSTVAIWGWVDDDLELIPAVRMFDVRDGRETNWFPGPECRRPGAWPPKKLAPSLFFDRYLFSVHEEHGTGVWDIVTGERLLQDPSLKPIGYHPLSKEFVTLLPDGVRLSRLAEG